jgi:hypothetical protein
MELPMRACLLVLLVPLLLGADSPDRLRKHLGDGVIDLLRHADRIEAFRVGALDPKLAGDANTVGGRVIVGQGVAVSAEQRDRLLAALLDERTYFSSDSKGTKTGVGLRVWTPKKECVEVSFCVEKGNVWMVAKDAGGKIIAQGDRRGFRDDKANPLRLISAELFPNDADLQKAKPSAAAVAARAAATRPATSDTPPAPAQPPATPAKPNAPAAEALPLVPGDVVLVATPGPEKVDCRIFIPVEAKPVRGVIVHAAHYTLKSDDRWAELCRELGFAHVALNIDMKQSNRPQKLGKALLAGLSEFASRAQKPELETCALCGVGHSAGGMVVGALHLAPTRLLATCVDCGWVTDPSNWPAESAGAPALFTMGAIPDGFKMLPAIEQFYEPARKQGLPWGLGVQWGCAHDFSNAATLQAIWLRSVARKRLAGGQGMMPARLEDGWLGDRASVNGRFATIAAYADYVGDKAAASWFPDRESAFVWRAWQTKDSPVHLTAATADGSAKLPTFDVKKSFGMTAPKGATVTLGLAGKGIAGVKKVTYFDGDRPIGSAASAPWTVEWKEAAPGIHGVWAQWESDDGKPAATNPALVVVRHH